MKRLKLAHQIVLVAVIGIAPIAALAIFLIRMSISAGIDFGEQELRGNAFQRPLEAMLELMPRHQALARTAASGDPEAKRALEEMRGQIDAAVADVEKAHTEFGSALKFTDAELAARQRDGARAEVLRAEWEALKKSPMEMAATDAATAKGTTGIRLMITHAGDTSNLILDSDLDSYYLMDATLLALPQTQDRLASFTLQVGEWLRAGIKDAQKTDIAVMAAMLRTDDVDRITADIQTSLNEDKNFRDLSASLQSKIPPARESYVAAN
jgi:hypothetical protein